MDNKPTAAAHPFLDRKQLRQLMTDKKPEDVKPSDLDLDWKASPQTFYLVVYRSPQTDCVKLRLYSGQQTPYDEIRAIKEGAETDDKVVTYVELTGKQLLGIEELPDETPIRDLKQHMLEEDILPEMKGDLCAVCGRDAEDPVCSSCREGDADE